MNVTIPKDKKIYFVSDVHLGLPPLDNSLVREKLLVKWLEEIRKDAFQIYLLGDIFDYWFEYKKVVPRGFVRFLGKIAEIRDSGIPVYFFTGNHDVWIFDYLPEELGVEIFRKPIIRIFNSKKFYLAHGDGLGPGEKPYKLLKSIFTSRFLQWIFARLHPNTATGFAHRWSKQSRFSKGNYVPWLGEEKEHLVLHSKKLLETEEFNFFIYGHRHVPKEFSINENSKLIYLGDWFVNFTYAVFDGEDVKLLKFSK